MTTLDDKFWSKVDRATLPDCWLWTGCTDRRGHATCRVGNTTANAARVAYEQLVGPVTPGNVFRPACGTRNCVRPEHQQIASRSEVHRAALAAKGCGRKAHGTRRKQTPKTGTKPIGVVTQQDVERFWSKVDLAHDSGCWLWRGSENDNGYGSMRLRSRKAVSAHRLAFELVHGPLPPDKIIRHTCSNRLCVCPTHLVAGTHVENTDDCVRAGRLRAGRRHKVLKLSDEQASAILALSQTGVSNKELATRFGVSPTTICDIKFKRRKINQ